MNATVDGGDEALTEKQRRILDYLKANADTQTYFKSRLIGRELGLSAKEVGTNMTVLETGDHGVTVEKWGYSTSTTWRIEA
ncbi:hypothetical protein [Haloarcula sp. JP-L23]|uniref:DUF7123 family protein n=1 Tax=Haloarcula sp. JP-L23 TaxID=2716717 RepID=UPI00140F0BF3|nr:hypothetical protein G9465_20745 [Haloarcula sp. JP-L23]